ncbi:MAG: 3-methyl-2-oxobutanoate hydroxymethyltransferase [Thiotrichales bacterium]|nr:3-methyl-2-oxobutanoate hydroxymethyltransferase [Thiotrichales bacterium]
MTVMDKKHTLSSIREMKANGERIACLTAYDAGFAQILDEAGVDIMLVGDSLGMVVQGKESTLPVTVDEMVYHTCCVSQGNSHSFLLADMPFMSYPTPEQAVSNAGRLMKEGGAHGVKLEGGREIVAVVTRLAHAGIPVCAHLGLLPQSVNKYGGYRVQGRDPEQAQSIIEDAKALEKAGADMLVLECIPRSLTEHIMAAVTIPVIGIGAGASCDGQVLVLYDMLGVTKHKLPRFVKNFLVDADSISTAVEAYVQAVKTGDFPQQEHGYN